VHSLYAFNLVSLGSQHIGPGPVVGRLGVGTGVGLGVGNGVGFGVGAGVVTGVGFGVGLGVVTGEGFGVGAGVGFGVGLGVVTGVGFGVGARVVTGVGFGVGAGVVTGVGFGVGLGVGAGVVTGVGFGVGASVVGEDEHPVDDRVLIVELTDEDHAPPKSCSATQKKAPPLQGCVFARSVITVDACKALALEPVPEQSLMQNPKTILFASPP